MTTHQAKIIPKFSTPAIQSREIGGLSVTVRRLPASLAPDVLARLGSDVGSIVANMISSPDTELDPAVEGAIRGMIATKGATAPSIDVSMGLIKAIVFSDALSKLGKFDLGWYVRQMIPGCVTIGGVAIDTMDELDQTDIGPMELFALFRFACEVNFLPTTAGRDTVAGFVSPAEPTTPTVAAVRTTGKSSLRGVGERGGQRAQTSAATT